MVPNGNNHKLIKSRCTVMHHSRLTRCYLVFLEIRKLKEKVFTRIINRINYYVMSMKKQGCWRARMSSRKTCGGKVLKKGPWSANEDNLLCEYVKKHGEGNWNSVQKNTMLLRCGKSCRLRWSNHLKPTLKKGAFSPQEEEIIIRLHAQLGNKWAKMASQLVGRTDNEIKNYWNTRSKRLQRKGQPLYPPGIESQVSPMIHQQTGFYAPPLGGYGGFIPGHPQQQMVPSVLFNPTPAPATHQQYLQPQTVAVAPLTQLPALVQQMAPVEQLAVNQVQSYAMMDLSNQVGESFVGAPMMPESQMMFTHCDQVLSNDDAGLLQMDPKANSLYDFSNQLEGPSRYILGNVKNENEMVTMPAPAQDHFSAMAGLVPANATVISNSSDMLGTSMLGPLCQNMAPDDGLKESLLIPTPTGADHTMNEEWSTGYPAWRFLPKLC